MKRWFPHMILLILLLLLSASTPLLAQEAGMSDVEIVDEAETVEGEKLRFVPGDEDVRYIPKAPGAGAAKDSIALQSHDFPMRQAAMKSPDRSNEKQPAKPKDDSILTFNFLYYIIQKYKLQDIID
jgi:hypothetical protein